MLLRPSINKNYSILTGSPIIIFLFFMESSFIKYILYNARESSVTIHANAIVIIIICDGRQRI